MRTDSYSKNQSRSTIRFRRSLAASIHTFGSVKDTSLHVHRLDTGSIRTPGRSDLNIGRLARNDIGPLLYKTTSRSEPGGSHSKSRSESGISNGLEGKGLGHDWATTSHDLEIGHRATADAIGTGSSGESTKGGG